MGNVLFSIYPYKHNGFWVFDDERVDLYQEPFVSGADTIIDEMTYGLENAEHGFRLTFSNKKFPGSMFTFEWVREENDGNWYYAPEFELEGWLCPAMFMYFEEAPHFLYARVDAMPVSLASGKKHSKEFEIISNLQKRILQ